MKPAAGTASVKAQAFFLEEASERGAAGGERSSQETGFWCNRKAGGLLSWAEGFAVKYVPLIDSRYWWLTCTLHLSTTLSLDHNPVIIFLPRLTLISDSVMLWYYGASLLSNSEFQAAKRPNSSKRWRGSKGSKCGKTVRMHMHHFLERMLSLGLKKNLFCVSGSNIVSHNPGVCWFWSLCLRKRSAGMMSDAPWIISFYRCRLNQLHHI